MEGSSKALRKLKNKFQLSRSGKDKDKVAGPGGAAEEPDVNVETFELGDTRKRGSPSHNKLHALVDFDRRSSLSSDRTLFNPQDIFLSKLGDERTKIDDFYQKLEAQLYGRFRALELDLQKIGALHSDALTDQGSLETGAPHEHRPRRRESVLSRRTTRENGEDEEEEEEELDEHTRVVRLDSTDSRRCV